MNPFQVFSDVQDAYRTYVHTFHQFGPPILSSPLDRLCSQLYGLEREELAYILDTFPIVERKDKEEYGEYRTKRLVLEAYDDLEDNELIGEPETVEA